MKPKPQIESHFMALPPEMISASAPALPPVIISGSPGPISSYVPSSMGAGSKTGVVQSWEADRGDSLRRVLERWARSAAVEFNWMAEYDYPLQASVHFTGTFEDAVRNLLVGFENAHPQPVAELHSNSRAGQTVLVVATRGNAGE